MKKVWAIILLVAFAAPILNLGLSPAYAGSQGGDSQGGNHDGQGSNSGGSSGSQGSQGGNGSGNTQ